MRMVGSQEPSEEMAQWPSHVTEDAVKLGKAAGFPLSAAESQTATQDYRCFVMAARVLFSTCVSFCVSYALHGLSSPDVKFNKEQHALPIDNKM